MSELDQRQDAADAVVRGDDIDTAPIPGKLTQYIEKGAVCDQDATKPGCFLTSEQRQRTIAEYQNRVGHARESYRLAILRLQLDKLTTSPSKDLPWIAELIFDIVGAHAFTSLLGAIQAIKAGELRMIERRVAEDAAGEQLHTHLDAEMHRSLRGLSDTSMGWWAKEMTDRGKKGASAALKSSLGVQAKSDGAKQIDYLDLLASQSSGMFQALREDPPGSATDAQLVALYKAFDDKRHSMEIYEQAITNKVDRFMSAGLDKIGVHMEPHKWREMAQTTKVVRCRYGTGLERLAYMTSDRDDPQHVGEWIPREFEAVAIARHEQVWGEPIQDMIVATPASSAGTLLPHTSPAARAGAGLMRAAGGALPRLDLGKKGTP